VYVAAQQVVLELAPLAIKPPGLLSHHSCMLAPEVCCSSSLLPLGVTVVNMSWCICAVAGSRATVFAATDRQAPGLAANTDSHYLDAHAEPVQPSNAAGDMQLAAWLWEWSKGQTHMPDDWDVAAA
jgi:hypothetical protein